MDHQRAIRPPPAVWPIGTERPKPRDGVHEGIERVAAFGRELDRARRAEHVAQRDAARARADGRHEARRARDGERDASPRDEAPRGERVGRERAAVAPNATPDARRAPLERPRAPSSEDAALAEAPQVVRKPESTPRTPAEAPARAATPDPRTQDASPHAAAAPAIRPHSSAPAPGNPATPARGDAHVAQPSTAPGGERATATRAAPERAPSADGPRFEQVLDQLKPELRPALRQALVVLEPADLGRVAIRVRLAADGLRATLRADSAETHALLERHLPELRAAFEAQGLEVAHLEVQHDGARGDTHGGARGHGGARHAAHASTSSAAADARTGHRHTHVTNPRATDGSAIDTFA